MRGGERGERAREHRRFVALSAREKYLRQRPRVPYSTPCSYVNVVTNAINTLRLHAIPISTSRLEVSRKIGVAPRDIRILSILKREDALKNEFEKCAYLPSTTPTIPVEFRKVSFIGKSCIENTFLSLTYIPRINPLVDIRVITFHFCVPIKNFSIFQQHTP